VLSAGAELEGRLTTPGSARIEGSFKGGVTARGRVVIGGEARLEGDVIGEVVTVAGLVRGNVTARKVSITGSGRVLGDLRVEWLATEEGSFIQGVIRMEEKVDIAAVIETRKQTALPAEAPEDVSLEAKPHAAEPAPLPVPARSAPRPSSSRRL
jgi:cytoskeletal protein CcmA (bactofilin family)